MANKLVLGIVIIAVVLGGGYFVTYINIETAANAVFESMHDGDETYEVIGFTLFPPSADMELRYPVINPTNYGFTLTIRADLYIGSTYIDEINIVEEIAPNGRSVIVIPIHIGSSIIDSMTDDSEFEIEGTRTVSTNMFGIIPVSITENYDEIN